MLALQASTLESCAARAGAALGCSYTNSTEYEAELIAKRRAAGAYVTKNNRWTALIVVVAAFVCAVMFAILLAR
jgi:hypothetical protein